MNFVAQFRIVQRLIMLCTIIWISLVLYKTGIISSVVSQLSLYTQLGENRYYNFNINDTRIPEDVRRTLNKPDMIAAVGRVLHQV